MSAIALLVAGIALAVAGGSWWLQRTVFTPGPSADLAEAVLDDPGIRLEINTVVSARTASALGTTPDQLAAFLESQVLATRGAAVELAEFIQRAHLRAIGSNDDLVVLVPTELVQVVRDERAMDASEATIPIPVIGTLKTTRTSVGWLMMISAGIGVLALAVGLVLRPYRSELLRALGEMLIALAASVIIIGWAWPVFVIPAIDSNTWTAIAPRLAGRNLPVIIGGSLVLVIGGLAAILGGINAGRRSQWSGSAQVRNYREQRGWT